MDISESLTLANGTLWQNWLITTRALIAASRPVLQNTDPSKARTQSLGIDLSVFEFAISMAKQFPEETPGREDFIDLCRRQKKRIVEEMEEIAWERSKSRR